MSAATLGHSHYFAAHVPIRPVARRRPTQRGLCVGISVVSRGFAWRQPHGSALARPALSRRGHFSPRSQKKRPRLGPIGPTWISSGMWSILVWQIGKEDSSKPNPHCTLSNTLPFPFCLLSPPLSSLDSRDVFNQRKSRVRRPVFFLGTLSERALRINPSDRQNFLKSSKII